MRLKFKFLLVIGIASFCCLIFLFSPYFYITEINISGCENITKDEILRNAGIDSTTNLFLYNTSEARKRILANLYIDRVTFTKGYPNTLLITIRERHLSGYVEYIQDKYLYIDEVGRVMEINSIFTEKLPVVSGLNFNKVRLGDILDVDDASSFKAVVTYAQLINKHEMSDMVSHIDVSDSGNTRILVHHIEFNVGDGKNADEKVRTMKEIVEKLPNAAFIKGFVDLKEIREQYCLKILV